MPAMPAAWSEAACAPWIAATMATGAYVGVCEGLLDVVIVKEALWDCDGDAELDAVEVALGDCDCVRESVCVTDGECV